MSAPAVKVSFSRPRVLWREFARALANLLPKGLYARSLLIVIAPMVLLQTAVAYIFMERHWELVTHRLSAAVARDIGAAIDLYRDFPPAPGDDRLKTIYAERFHLDVDLAPAERDVVAGVVREKCAILAGGAARRGRADEAARYALLGTTAATLTVETLA